MTENKKDVPQTVHDTLFLPTLIQESLLPLRTGPKKATRKYRDVDITVRAGAFQGRDLVLPAGAIALVPLRNATTFAHIIDDRDVGHGAAVGSPLYAPYASI